MALRLIALNALPEDPSLIPVINIYLQLQFQGIQCPILAYADTRHKHNAVIHEGKTLIYLGIFILL